MAAPTKSGVPSLATGVPDASHQLMGIANATIAAGAACRIVGVTARDEPLFAPASGAAADVNRSVFGYAARDARAGEGLTLFHDVEFGGYSGLTPGNPVFLSGTTAGELDLVATTGGTTPIGYAVTAERIWLKRKLHLDY
jgi:hypothetical protein